MLDTVSFRVGQVHVAVDTLMWGGSNVIHGQGSHRLNAALSLPLGTWLGQKWHFFNSFHPSTQEAPSCDHLKVMGAKEMHADLQCGVGPVDNPGRQMWTTCLTL